MKKLLSLIILTLTLVLGAAEVFAAAAPVVRKSYTIAFDANGGLGKMRSLKFKSSEDLRLPDSNFTMEGYRFAGWKLSPYSSDDKVDFPERGVITAGSITGKKKKVTLYAVWKALSPREYYVAPAGSDSAPGTKEASFKSIAKALSVAAGGDTVHVAAGVYDEELCLESGGCNTDPVTVKGELSADGTCLSKLTHKGVEEYITLLDMNGQSNMMIEDMEIGDIEAKYACGIFVGTGTKNLTVSGCFIHGIKVDSRFLNPSEEEAEDTGEGNAILLLGEGKKASQSICDVQICNNVIRDNVTNWSESVSVAGNCERVFIRNNLVCNNTNIGIDFNGNTGYCKKAKFDRPRDCEASGNTVSGCHCGYASCAGIYVDGAQNTAVFNNEVTDCDYGIEVGAEIKKSRYPVKNISVYGNIVHDNRQGGLWIGGYEEKSTGLVKDCVIEDNYFEDNGEAEIVINKCKKITFSSNTITRKKNMVPLICGEMSKKYTSKLFFNKNIYQTYVEPEAIPFKLHDKELNGLDAFNAYTKGSDSALKLP